LIFIRHLGCDFGKAGSLGRRKIVHLRPFRLDTHLFKGSLNVFDFPSGFEISFQEMTFTFQSTGHVYAVGTALEGGQQVEDVHPAAARHLNHLDIAWIIQAHGSGQVGSCIRTVLAAVRQDLGFKGFIHGLSPMMLWVLS
jgi:hypothetical protein